MTQPAPAPPISAPMLARASGTAPIEILLLDDSDVDLRRLTRALRKMGRTARIFGCRTLTEFERALNADTYDLCLIDHSLDDGTSGEDALELLRAHSAHRATPAVLMFEFADPALLIQASQAGFATYLEKTSLSPDQMIHVVKQALEQSRPAAPDAPIGQELHSRIPDEMATSHAQNSKLQIHTIYEQVEAMRRVMVAGQVPDFAALDTIERACFKLWRFADTQHVAEAGPP